MTPPKRPTRNRAALPQQESGGPPAPLGTGPRVFIRRPCLADESEFLARTRQSRPLHTPWVRAPQSSAEFRTYVERPSDRNLGLLVCQKEEGAIAGVVNMNEIVQGLFRSAFLGYYGLRPYDGIGYMSEGIDLVLRLAFRTLKLHRAEANIQPANKSSIELVRRLGFRLEGYSPKYLKIGGSWKDHERWAILADEWKGAALRPKKER